MGDWDGWAHLGAMVERHRHRAPAVIELTDLPLRVAFLGEPYAREVVHIGGRWRLWQPGGVQVEPPTLRVAINALVEHTDEVRVIDGGPEWGEALYRMRMRVGWWVDVAWVSGRYHITTVAPIPQPVWDHIRARELHHLPDAVLGA